jgi:DNA-binding FadR family transcriptional regulator
MPPRVVKQLFEQLPQAAARARERDEWEEGAPEARLADRLSERMAALIESGEFPEGARLPAECDLASRFGVSRPVIREALSRLRVAGVVTSRRGSGSYVQRRAHWVREAPGAVGFAPFTSLAQLRKCYQFRVSIEGDAAYYAATNRTPDMLAVMRDALDRMEKAVAEGVVGMSPDIEFHFAVARASENEFFEAVLHSMRGPLEFAVNLARSLSLTRPLEHLLLVQAQHVAIYEAIREQDPEAARLAMRTHIQSACQRVFEGPDGAEAFGTLLHRG